MDALESADRESRKGGGAGVPAKVWEVLILVFYAVQGIFILLFDIAKNAFKPKPPSRPRAVRPGSTPPPAAAAERPAAPPASRGTLSVVV